MNKNRNLEIVNEYGDQAQLTFGTEFGYYASQIDFESMMVFCYEFNSDAWAKSNGYRLNIIKRENFHKLAFTNNIINFKSTATLLDHTVYIEAKEEDWKILDKNAFSLIQHKWRVFLSKNISGYREHFNETRILTTENIKYAI